MKESPFEVAFRYGYMKAAKQADDKRLLSLLLQHGVSMRTEFNPFPAYTDDGGTWTREYESGLAMGKRHAETE